MAIILKAIKLIYLYLLFPLETSESVKACNGIALHLPLPELAADYIDICKKRKIIKKKRTCPVVTRYSSQIEIKFLVRR
jgi:hypothetical protein